MPGAVLTPAGSAYVEALDTRRSDVGAAFQTLSATGVMWSARGSWTSQRQHHQYGEITERDDHDTGFAELTVRRAIGRPRWWAAWRLNAIISSRLIFHVLRT